MALVYDSRVTAPLSGPQLMELLEECRAHNAEHGITGVLLHEDGAFLQLLEGGERDVNELYARIRTDPRHSEVQTVWVSAGAQRHFSSWSMAFADLDHSALGHPAFSDMLSAREAMAEPGGGDLLRVLESSLQR